MNSIPDMKKLFLTRLEQEERDREEMIKSRIRNFNERHRETGAERAPEPGNRGKSRTIWEN
jgi:hypothetical protein